MLEQANIHELSKLNVNLEEVLKRFSGNAPLYLRFVNMFPDDKNYQSFNDEFDAGNYEKAADSVHGLKGVSGNLGFDKLFFISNQMLLALRNNNIDEAKVLRPKLDREYKIVANTIKAF